MQRFLDAFMVTVLAVHLFGMGFVVAGMVLDSPRGGCPCSEAKPGEVACGGCKCGDHCDCCKDCRRWCGDKNCPEKP